MASDCVSKTCQSSNHSHPRRPSEMGSPAIVSYAKIDVYRRDSNMKLYSLAVLLSDPALLTEDRLLPTVATAVIRADFGWPRARVRAAFTSLTQSTTSFCLVGRRFAIACPLLFQVHVDDIRAAGRPVLLALRFLEAVRFIDARKLAVEGVQFISASSLGFLDCRAARALDAAVIEDALNVALGRYSRADCALVIHEQI